MVSQVHYFILTDPTIFPDPHTFDPERWIRAAAKGERLEKYLVNFSKGSRNCLGKKYAPSTSFPTIRPRPGSVINADMSVVSHTQSYSLFSLRLSANSNWSCMRRRNRLLSLYGTLDFRRLMRVIWRLELWLRKLLDVKGWFQIYLGS